MSSIYGNNTSATFNASNIAVSVIKLPPEDARRLDLLLGPKLLFEPPTFDEVDPSRT